MSERERSACYRATHCEHGFYAGLHVDRDAPPRVDVYPPDTVWELAA